MFLSIATTHQPATDLGYLLHKHPERLHEIEQTFGKAWVFYPEASDRRCQAALVLDVDPVGLGHEALKRFVAREPLRRVHECVFAVLALESEPIDPRL
jgi:hypothetical protein